MSKSEFAKVVANKAIAYGEFHNVPEDRYADALEAVAEEFRKDGYDVMKCDGFELPKIDVGKNE